MITKDGTVVPIYFWNDRFLMPFVVPSDSTASGGSSSLNETDESSMNISAFGTDDKNNDDFEEAVVRLHAAPIDQNKFIIDPSIGDRLAPSTAEERNRVVHNALGHIS